MAIIKQDGFEFYEGLNGHRTFSLKGLNLSEELSYINKKQILSVAIEDSNSILLNDLSFLKEVNMIEELHVGSSPTNYSGIYHLENLKKITINGKNRRQNLDYSKFRKLEFLSIDWCKEFPDLSKNKELKELYIWKFRPQNKTFEGLSLPKNLNLLHITESNVVSLDGLEDLKIEQFEAYYCSKLESIKALEGVSKHLNTLILENCKNVKDFDRLRTCSEMEKMILTKCGEIPNLKWLKSMKKLKMFTFLDTHITDGDLSNCMGIHYVYFRNSKNYNHRVEEFSNL